MTDKNTAVQTDIAAYMTDPIRKALGKVETSLTESQRLSDWADCLLFDLWNLKPGKVSGRRYAAMLRETSPVLARKYGSDASLATRFTQVTKLAREHDASTGSELGKALDLIKATTGKSATTRKTSAGKGKGKANGGAGGNESKPATVPDAIDALDAASLVAAGDPSKVTKAERHAVAQAVRSAVVLALAAGLSQDDIAGIIADAAAAAAMMRAAA